MTLDTFIMSLADCSKNLSSIFPEEQSCGSLKEVKQSLLEKKSSSSVPNPPHGIGFAVTWNPRDHTLFRFEVDLWREPIFRHWRP